MNNRRNPQEPDSGRSRYQFSLRTLLGITVLVSVLSAVLGGIIRLSEQGDQRNPLLMLYVLAAVCLPFGVLIVVSAYATVRRMLARRRRQLSDRERF